MAQRDVIVVGASAGGIEPLRTLVAALPAELPASLLVVVHIPAGVQSSLPAILERAGRLRVAPVASGPLEHGTIYVAPPDHHLVLCGNAAHLSRGPTVNGYRPAVDALFRTAAREAGPRVMGVILSGALDDGADGMVDIAKRGGVTLVQDPTEALHDSMPREAMSRLEVDHVLPAAGLAKALVALAEGEVPDVPHDAGCAPPPDPPSPFTCPECHGGLGASGGGSDVR
jgi:two-component system chemotaxis response regulator CheB